MVRARGPGRINRLRAALVAVFSLLLVVGVAQGVGADGRELGQAASVLAHPWAGWIILGLLLEVASFIAYALAQHRLVRVTGHQLSTGWLASLAACAQALNNFLPAGYVAANALNFREFRHRGLSAGEAVSLLVMSSVLYIGSLGVLALVGLGLLGGPDGGTTRYLSIGACIFALTLLGMLSLGARRRGAARAQAEVLPERVSRLQLLWGRGKRATRTLMASVAEISLSRRATAAGLLLFASCWLLDVGCLIAALHAVGARVPWQSLLAAYCGAQLISFLPITPGGLGLVEGSLTVTLTAGGLGAVHVLAGVLLYRAMSYWGTLPAGALGYIAVRRTRPGTNGSAGVASLEWPLQTVSAAPSST